MSFTAFQRTYMLRPIVSLDPWLQSKRKKKPSQMPSSGKTTLSHLVPWLCTLYNYPFITISSYGALRYGTCIHRHQVADFLTDLIGWIAFLTIFNWKKPSLNIATRKKSIPLLENNLKYMLCFFSLNTPVLEGQCPWKFLFLATVGRKVKHTCLVLACLICHKIATIICIL